MFDRAANLTMPESSMVPSLTGSTPFEEQNRIELVFEGHSCVQDIQFTVQLYDLTPTSHGVVGGVFAFRLAANAISGLQHQWTPSIRFCRSKRDETTNVNIISIAYITSE